MSGRWPATSFSAGTGDDQATVYSSAATSVITFLGEEGNDSLVPGRYVLPISRPIPCYRLTAF